MGDCHGSDHANIERRVPRETNRESEHICYSLDCTENLSSVDVCVTGIDWTQSIWWGWGAHVDTDSIEL